MAQWPLKDKSVIGWDGDYIQDNLSYAMWESERWAYNIIMSPYETGQNAPSAPMEFGISQSCLLWIEK